MNLNPMEREIAICALALIGKNARLSCTESELAASLDTGNLKSDALRGMIAETRYGHDPLGERLRSIRGGIAGKSPPGVSVGLAHWIARQEDLSRIVDTCADTGTVLRVVAQELPQSSLVAIERDARTALVLRANLVILGLHRRTRIVVSGEDIAALPQSLGRVAYLGCAMNISGSGNASPRHRLEMTGRLAKPGDTGVFLAPAEWLDSTEAAASRRLLVEKLGVTKVHFMEPRSGDEEMIAAICIRCGDNSSTVGMRFARTPVDATAMNFEVGVTVSREWLRHAACWTEFANPEEPQVKKA